MLGKANPRSSKFKEMDAYSDHSAILDYLAQVEQEEQLRESLKNKSGIAALRVERGKNDKVHPCKLAKLVGAHDPAACHCHSGVCPRSIEVWDTMSLNA